MMPMATQLSVVDSMADRPRLNTQGSQEAAKQVRAPVFGFT